MARLVEVVVNEDGSWTEFYDDGSRILRLREIEIVGRTGWSHAPFSQSGPDPSRISPRQTENSRATNRPEAGQPQAQNDRIPPSPSNYAARLRNVERELEALRAEQREQARQARRERLTDLGEEYARQHLQQRYHRPSTNDGYSYRPPPTPVHLSRPHEEALEFAIELGTLNAQVDDLIEQGGPTTRLDPSYDGEREAYAGPTARPPSRVPTELGHAINAGLIIENDDGSLTPVHRTMDDTLRATSRRYPGFREAHQMSYARYRARADLERLYAKLAEIALLAIDVVALGAAALGPLARFLGRARAALEASRAGRRVVTPRWIRGVGRTRARAMREWQAAQSGQDRAQGAVEVVEADEVTGLARRPSSAASEADAATAGRSGARESTTDIRRLGSGDARGTGSGSQSGRIEVDPIEGAERYRAVDPANARREMRGRRSLVPRTGGIQRLSNLAQDAVRRVAARLGTSETAALRSIGSAGDDVVGAIERFHAVSGFDQVLGNYLAPVRGATRIARNQRQGARYVMRFAQANFGRADVPHMAFEARTRPGRFMDLIVRGQRFEFKAVSELRNTESLRRQLRRDLADLLAQSPYSSRGQRWVFDRNQMIRFFDAEGRQINTRDRLLDMMRGILRERSFAGHPRIRDIESWMNDILVLW